MDADSKKKAAALAALEYVEDGMTVGVGTGSTVNHFIAALKDRRHRIAGAVSLVGSEHPAAERGRHRGARPSTTPATCRSTSTAPTRPPATSL